MTTLKTRFAGDMFALLLSVNVLAQTRITPNSTLDQAESHIAVNPTDQKGCDSTEHLYV